MAHDTDSEAQAGEFAAGGGNYGQAKGGLIRLTKEELAGKKTMQNKEDQRFRISLQPFSKELTDKYNILEMTCPNCNNLVQSTCRKQAELADGGAGHECKNCNSYLAVFQCPKCMATITVDDKEWQELAKQHGIACPSCKATLYREKQPSPIMSWSNIMMPVLSCWSDTENEKQYIIKINKKLNNKQKNIVTIRHHSVSVRMLSAKDSLSFLLTNEWYSSLVMMNSLSPVKDDKIYKDPFDHDFHNHFFGLINNLRSALDILAQEIAAILSPETPERNTDLGNINKIIKNTELASLINDYKSSASFIYLNKIRNVLQHRRIPLMVTEAPYDTSELDTIRPVSIRAKVVVALPTDPYKMDFFDRNNYGVMLFPKINELYSNARIFMIDIYSLLARLLPSACGK